MAGSVIGAGFGRSEAGMHGAYRPGDWAFSGLNSNRGWGVVTSFAAVGPTLRILAPVATISMTTTAVVRSVVVNSTSMGRLTNSAPIMARIGRLSNATPVMARVGRLTNAAAIMARERATQQS